MHLFPMKAEYTDNNIQKTGEATGRQTDRQRDRPHQLQFDTSFTDLFVTCVTKTELGLNSEHTSDHVPP